jgi:hypothetical protein
VRGDSARVPGVVRDPQRDLHPRRAEARPHLPGEPGQQVAHADAPVELLTEGPEHLVPGGAAAVDEPVGERLDPAPHRLEGHRDEDRQHDGDLDG